MARLKSCPDTKPESRHLLSERRGSGATFQLVPLRWPLTTAVAGGMIGEIGALGGYVLPNVLGYSKQHTGSFRAGWIAYAAVACCVLVVTRLVARKRTKTWVGKGGRALVVVSGAPQELAAD